MSSDLAAESARALADLAGEAMADVDAHLRKRCATGCQSVDEALAATYLGSGKRIRPMLTLAVANGMGCTDRSLAVRGASAVELLHVATLIHDDVIDGAETRRGKPALHTQIGVPRAIVVGDLVLATGGAESNSLGPEIAHVWSSALTSVCRGQNLEFDLRNDLGISDDVLLHYAGLKTAALISASCEIGALLADGSLNQRVAAREFGWNFGVAFQLVDDLLDIVGDPEMTGKPSHQDVPNGIYTSAVIDALTHELTAGLSVLRDSINGGDYERAYSIVGGGRSIDRTVERVREFAARARESLHGSALAELGELPMRYVEGALSALVDPGLEVSP